MYNLDLLLILVKTVRLIDNQVITNKMALVTQFFKINYGLLLALVTLLVNFSVDNSSVMMGIKGNSLSSILMLSLLE